MSATIILITIAIVTIFIVIGRSLSNNRNTTDGLRNNNRKSEDINRETGDIVEKLQSDNRKLESENREAGELNESIRKDNQTAGDIIKQVRKQKLDR